MSTFKKLLALTLALAMVLSVSAFAGYKADTYKDAASIDPDCEDAIEMLYALEIMKGDDKGNFNPEATITRAEVAKMIYVILNYGDDDKAINYTGANIFSDVKVGDWYEGYVNYCYITKLVQGRGDGTFGPNDPVTTPEAAKMLLTAIGYVAEDRGYTGATWSQNVLRDAAIIGLLDNYDYNTMGYAPRQWVAVMFWNALENALTYDKMTPVITGGLLTSITGSSDTLTMGKKYYDIEYFTSVAVATEKTSLLNKDDLDEDEDLFAENGVLFANGEDLAGTGLTYDDLGQEYKVILVDEEVVSVRNTGTSVVAEALLRDITAKTLTGTSDNKQNNRYQFTIGDLTAKLAKGADFITLGRSYKGEVSADALSAATLYGEANGKTANIPTEIKAIDADNNGEIDYVVYTEYKYSKVTSTGTSRAYGDYVTIENVKYGNDSRLYVEDTIITDDDLAKNDYVKYNADHEAGKYVVEELPWAEETLDRVTNKGTYIIGGETYVTSDAETAYGEFEILVKKNVEETIVIVFDGDMLVVVTWPDAEPTTLEEINAQLCVVTDKTHHYYTGWERAFAVEILTIDNETAKYVLAEQDDATVYEGINVIGEHECDEEFVNYLYVFSINDDDEITLEPIAATQEGVDYLDYDDNEEYDVIDAAKVGHEDEWTVSDDLNGDIVELENLFFVGTGEDDDFEVAVMTLDELADLTGYDVHYEGLYATGKYFDTLVAGYVAADEWVEEDDIGDGYLYLTAEAYYDKADKADMAEVIFADGTEDTIVITNDYETVEMYTLYSYKYSTINDEYTLTAVEAKEKSVEMKTYETKDLDVLLDEIDLAAAEADELVKGFKNDSIWVYDIETEEADRTDLTDCIIAVKNITLDLDEKEDDTIEVTYDIEFVTLDELKEMKTIFNEYEEDHDVYYSDFTYVEEDLFYVEVYRIVEDCQPLVK